MLSVGRREILLRPQGNTRFRPRMESMPGNLQRVSFKLSLSHNSGRPQSEEASLGTQDQPGVHRWRLFIVAVEHRIIQEPNLRYRSHKKFGNL